MRIAITGATGFLGRYIVRQLSADGHQLRCWYRDEARQTRVPEQVEWQRGTLEDADARAALVEGVDAVVHAALSWPAVRGGSDRDDFVEFVQTNLLGSLMLMNTAYQADVGRFIFISTCAVHDEILSDRPLDEAHPLWSYSHYGAYKAALEKFVHSFGLGQGWPVCSLRPTGIYGLADPPSASRWYGTVERVLAGGPIESTRGGKEVHAADVAKAVALLLDAETETIRGQAYNCYDIYVSEQRVAQITREIADVDCDIADVNRGPKNQIQTGKLRALGMAFGGEPLLRETVTQLVEACRQD